MTETTAPATKTFLVERLIGSSLEKIEVQATKGEQETGTSRVTFYNGDEAVGSFINIQAWYEKPAAA
jgi:hypothetical protein